MGINNKKVILAVFASLAALLLLTFQNCSANLVTAVTAVTATPVYACEKEVHAVDNLIRDSDDEIEVTKKQMTAEPKGFFRKNAFADEAKYGADRIPRALKKNSFNNLSKSKVHKSAKANAKKNVIKNKKPARKSASDDNMKIRLKKIKPKKTVKGTGN